MTNVLPPPPMTETDTARNFVVKRGFRVELAASEQVVSDPVAMAFDEYGRLFVLEQPNSPAAQGRVRLLVDTDGNGTFNSSSIYADNLVNPTAITCYGGGVFVAASGQVLFLKDTKGDGVADARREVFKCFGEPTNGANGQVTITALAWGMDNRIHAVTTSHGGDVISSSAPKQSIVLSEGGFSFNPRTFVLAAESGVGASGMCFDDRGHEFLCAPTEPAEVIMFSVRSRTQNPYYELPPAASSVATGPVKLIYPPARPGALPPMPISFSAANGITAYRGNAFPRDYANDLFVADVNANVVHHIKLTPNGIEFTAMRGVDEETSEFLAGRDNSFQPMSVANGPDGTLYVAGLSREVLVASVGKSNAVPFRPTGHGAIYRIAPVDFVRTKLADMTRMPADQLVAMLKHPNGWCRDTAQRLLFERQDRATTAPLLRLLFDPQSLPLARLHALHALDGIELVMPRQTVPMRALMEAHLLKALTDFDERVREHAVLLSAKFISTSGVWSDTIWGQLSRMGNDPSPWVRYQLALTLGQGHNSGRAQVLADVARSDPKMSYAVLSALSDGAAEVFGATVGDAGLRNDFVGQTVFFPGLISIVANKNQPGEVAQMVIALQNVPEPKLAFEFANALEQSVAQNDASLITVAGPNVLTPLYTRAAAVAANLNADDEGRAKALRFLADCGPADPNLVAIFGRQWPSLRPWLQGEALRCFLQRPEWMAVLMSALESGLIPRTSLTPDEIRFLLAYPEPNIRQRAALLFTNWNSLQRQNVVNQFAGALQMAGNTARGRKVFENANCFLCHQGADGFGGISFNASLADESKLGKQKLLTRILNPNGTGQTRYPVTISQLRNGALVTGFVATQTSKYMMICDGDGHRIYLAHSNVSAQSNLGFSGMPEGAESRLSVQDMADLLEYLCPQK